MKSINVGLVIITIACCAHLILPAQALRCYCNECNDSDSESDQYCVTQNHRDSNCFKSVERFIENNTYQYFERYGCLSGADDSLASLQCHVGALNPKEPIFMICCNDKDDCNLDLREPDESDDPRWNMTQPPIASVTETNNKSQTSLLPVICITVFVTCIALIVCTMLYRIMAIVFRDIIARRKSSSSFKESFDEDPIKNQFANHDHHNPGSSSASTHTYTISDYLSQTKPSSPFEHSLASMEHTSTLPDLTSGVGTRVLEPRTMARVVDSGTTVLVGSGRFGRVFKGSYHGEDVAVKAFKSIDHESWQREEKILRKLNNEHIVRYIASETYAVAMHQTETWMFLEFCPYGSLCDFLDRNEICGPQQAIKILYSIIKGLSYLHEDFSTGYKPPIAHRDIKSRNILMRNPENCCLADFGHAVVKINEKTLDFGGYDRLQVGTIRYMAPEILKPNETLDTTQFHTFAQADLYQFALVLWEVCYRTSLDVLHPAQPHRLPYETVVPQNPDLQDMIKIVCEENYRPPRPLHWAKHPMMTVLNSLMEECWRSNPKARMETLGVKKRLKGLFDQTTPQQTMFYYNNITDNFTTQSPNLKVHHKNNTPDMTL